MAPSPLAADDALRCFCYSLIKAGLKQTRCGMAKMLSKGLQALASVGDEGLDAAHEKRVTSSPHVFKVFHFPCMLRHPLRIDRNQRPLAGGGRHCGVQRQGNARLNAITTTMQLCDVWARIRFAQI
jgi:hypothetical protein